MMFLRRSHQNLPYVDAIIKEVHRWRPISPFSSPHQLMKDDMYKGSCLCQLDWVSPAGMLIATIEYLIPKGSIVIQNTWCAIVGQRMLGWKIPPN